MSFYYLDYVEDIYIRVLSVRVSILNPNYTVFTTSNKLYTTIRAPLLPFQSLRLHYTLLFPDPRFLLNIAGYKIAVEYLLQ